MNDFWVTIWFPLYHHSEKINQIREKKTNQTQLFPPNPVKKTNQTQIL